MCSFLENGKKPWVIAKNRAFLAFLTSVLRKISLEALCSLCFDIIKMRPTG